ncbi:MAG: N-acetylmuramoyl-L-alanine amidase [Pseudorhodoplanes sp.]|jgi:N-acetylmuramoyl-L-alanine amidase|nr:N-acetylmuramoyl-L-alanine amidase [Pseudorhodoplanes sp.]
MVRLNILRWRRAHIAPLLAASIAATAFASGVVQAEKSKPRPSCDQTQFRVLLDVGHTAEEPGAISARSMTEYDFNLRLAREIERALLEAGFAKTALQVASGAARSALIKRVVDANAANADLLLSIHHDSVPDWLLLHMDEEGGPKRFNDRFKGHSIFISYENADRAGSLQFARMLGRALKEEGLQFTPHYTEKFMRSRRRQLLDKQAGIYRFDKLYVLRGARMPAVLFEAGMIINPDEEAILASEARQRLLAAATKEAVEKFCRSRGSREASSGRKRK